MPCGVQADLNERLVSNIIGFLGNQLRKKGTRSIDDQNIHNAILTAAVDGSMMKENKINAVATRLGQRWEAVKSAVLRRIKLDQEEEEKAIEIDEGGPGQPKLSVWKQLKRSTRCDKYELPGLYAFCHDETYFRFSSRRSEPLREHTALRECARRSHCSAAPWCASA